VLVILFFFYIYLLKNIFFCFFYFTDLDMKAYMVMMTTRNRPGFPFLYIIIIFVIINNNYYFKKKKKIAAMKVVHLRYLKVDQMSRWNRNRMWFVPVGFYVFFMLFNSS
jgi:hypothetical protein